MTERENGGSSGLRADPRDPLNAVAVVPRHVVYRGFVRETIAVDLNTGRYHRLDPARGRTLEALDRTKGSLREAAAMIATELGRPFEETAQELRRVCGELGERGLVEFVH